MKPDSLSATAENRRSIKYFDSNATVSDDDFNSIMQTTLLSPTAFNIQHWRFVRVVDAEKRIKLRELSWGQPQLTDASEIIVFCMDKAAWQKQPERYCEAAPEDIQKILLSSIESYYTGNELAQRDEGMRSCSLAAMTFMLAAQSLGYDTCPMDGFDFDAVSQLINLPADHEICMIVALGKAARAPWPRGKQLSLNEVMVTDKF